MARADGREPQKRFCERSRSVRFWQVEIEEGMVELIELLRRLRVERLGRRQRMEKGKTALGTREREVEVRTRELTELELQVTPV